VPRKPKLYDGKTIDQHAAEIGEPRRTVDRWIKDGMPTLEPARSQWVANHKRTRSRRTGVGVSFDAKDDPLARKISEDIRYRQLKNAQLALQLKQQQGVLISSEEAKRQQVRLASLVKKVFLELPSSVAVKVAACESIEEIRSTLEADVHTRLNRIASVGAE